MNLSLSRNVGPQNKCSRRTLLRGFPIPQVKPYLPSPVRACFAVTSIDFFHSRLGLPGPASPPGLGDCHTHQLLHFSQITSKWRLNRPSSSPSKTRMRPTHANPPCGRTEGISWCRSRGLSNGTRTGPSLRMTRPLPSPYHQCKHKHSNMDSTYLTSGGPNSLTIGHRIATSPMATPTSPQQWT